ncbi:hypothetical protein LTR10_009004 [Elasticomyces elasticus]|nr:hypothetical protein LTR10_009004 [Elasticomyces elasticus]KAK4964770.1 hypothetical protein LTR42_012714 [Elasticomyces elasticus]
MDDCYRTAAVKLAGLGTVLAVLSFLYVVGKVIYSLYLSPLAKIPGRKLDALSRIPYVRRLLSSTTVTDLTQLHEWYGDVVRFSPTEVSFITEEAWQAICGFRTGPWRGHSNMPKDPAWYPKPANGVPSILIADDADHTRHRRALAHAFSEKALTEQMGLVQDYVDQLIDGLKDAAARSSAPVNLAAWYVWTTFDVISDLLWGEPFGCLRDRATHKYVRLLFRSVEAFRFAYIKQYFPWVKYFGSLVLDTKVLADRLEYWRWVGSQTRKRTERETQRPDFMTYILKHNNGEKGDTPLSAKEIESDAHVFVTAGSETTATMLSATTFLLLKNPAVMQKLIEEVRWLWKSYADITLDEVNKAPHLLAVCSEGLRYFPPVPAGFERRVPQGGEVVSGVYLPEGTSVSVSQYPAYHSKSNFRDPENFAPERWMGDEKYVDDKRASCQPFSIGPRNCIGKNLAYAEMRLILAKMIWSFDLELDSRSATWMDRCYVNTLWVKPELLVRVKEVVRL